MTHLVPTPGRLDEILRNLPIFLSCAAKTVFKRKQHNKETAYEHIIKFVFVQKAKTWYSASYGQGTGYFSLQGPESTNSSNKHYLMKRTNGKFSTTEHGYDSFVRVLRIHRIWFYFYPKIPRTDGVVRDEARLLKIHKHVF